MCINYLLRNIHFISENIARHTNKKIFIHKIDYKLVQEREHFNCKYEIQPITQIISELIELIDPRLTFGGSDLPNKCCIISETITEMPNFTLGYIYL